MYIPLAERMRPTSMAEVVGQDHLLSHEGLVTRSIVEKRPLSILLWGPPGSGKTTIAKLYAKEFSSEIFLLSAVTSGIADLKKLIDKIQSQPLLQRMPIIFIDEIHRWNKAQQDLLLPYVEKGIFILIGATTENPSFSLNNALLSRLRVLKLEALDSEALETVLQRYEQRYSPLPLTAEARQRLLDIAQGDARYLLNMVENLQSLSPPEPLAAADLLPLLQRRAALYDRAGEGHYNLISALHKSIRGSDPDAALYWLCRMLEGGEEPLYIARRLIRVASEDVGLADPQALPLAIAAREAYQTLGSPEGELALAQLVLYLALCPKSNAAYTAYQQARRLAAETSQLNPPPEILNAPTRLMKEMGYGKGYQYDHDAPQAFSGQDYFPAEVNRPSFYQPVERGFEREMRKRLDYFEKLRRRRE